MKTVLVVPCRDEERRLDSGAFRSFASRAPDVRFLFVDDGSGDGTARVLAGLAASLPGRVRVLSLDRCRGKAEAVRLGVLEALKEGADFVGYWDADLSAPLDALPDLIEFLRGTPALLAVFGARIKRLGARIERRPLRHFLGRLFATAASLLVRIPAYDTQCGAKLFRAGPPVESLFSRPFLSRWAFDVEILVRMRQAGLEPRDRVAEHPLREWRHVSGSKMSLLGGLRAFWDLWRLSRRRSGG